jgi:hypothetical protein
MPDQSPKRGAIPSPRNALAAAAPYAAPIGAPPTFIITPQKISMWGNDVHGDCVTAEEAFAKACNNPEVFIPDNEVIAWATRHGVLEGAYLTDVMTWMQNDGFPDGWFTEDDGPYYSINWTNAATLQSAISQGPVKIGIAADQIDAAWSSTGGKSGWFATGFHDDTNEDHCVSLCGYGSMSWLAQQLGVHVPAGIDGTKPGYAMFTWNSIGIIDVPSMIAITQEAWLRRPTTVRRGGFADWATQPGAQVVTGGFSGSARADIALVGGQGWPTVPAAFANGDGTWTIHNSPAPGFATWATQPGARVVTGGFGSGRTDLALVGGQGWATLPAAFANGDGTWTIHNSPTPGFATWATTPGVKVVTGGFSGSGRADIALVGGQGWSTVPAAFANGDGTWTIHNSPTPGFATWATQPGANVVTGGFSGSGRTDIALVGGQGWTTAPVAFANGDGTWTIHNSPAPGFAGWATAPGVKVVTGHFGSGRTDIALVGGPGWVTVPVAFANGDGTWTIHNSPAPAFATWATAPGVTVVTGDFSGSGRTDIALVGGQGWTTVPVAFANGDGTWTIHNSPPAPGFATWATTPGVKVVTGDFSGSGRTDIALVGGQGWTTVPVAFANGDGTWTIHNSPA